MEVVNPKVALLSNYEVLELMKEVKAKTSQKKKKEKSALADIAYDVVYYLQNSPCSVQSPEIISKFLHATKHLKIKKVEKLQLLNLRPSNDVEIYTIFPIDSYYTSLSEDVMKEMLELVKEHLPEPVEEDGNDVADETS